MHTKKERRLLCLLLALLILLLPACGQKDGGSQEAEDDAPGGTASEAEVLLPITLNGTEIRVGETTVQALLDQGLEVSWVDENFNRITVDPDTELEANSYYTGNSVKLTDTMSFNLSFTTDEEAVPLGQAVIARIELHMTFETDTEVLGAISFDGVPVTELTREKAGEMYPDWTGNDVMWLHYGLEYSYDLVFDNATGNLTGFTAERSYDVDWSS